MANEDEVRMFILLFRGALKSDLNQKDIDYLIVQLEEKKLIIPDFSPSELITVLNSFLIGARGRISYIDINELGERFGNAITGAFKLEGSGNCKIHESDPSKDKFKGFVMHNYLQARTNGSLAVQKENNPLRRCRIF